MAWIWIDTGATLVEGPDQPQPLTPIGAMIPVAAPILLVGRAHSLFFAVGGLIGTWARSGTDPVSRWSRFHRCTAASRWSIDPTGSRQESSFQDHGTRGAP